MSVLAFFGIGAGMVASANAGTASAAGVGDRSSASRSGVEPWEQGSDDPWFSDDPGTLGPGFDQGSTDWPWQQGAVPAPPTIGQTPAGSSHAS